MSPLTLIVIILILYVIIRHKLESSSFPPGPLRIPIIGSFLSIGGIVGSRLLLYSTQLAPKYGKLIGFFMGRFRVVFVQDFDLAREIASDDQFNNRLDHTYVSDMRGYDGRKIGVISTEGEGWRTHRRFALSTLKEFGFGKKSMSSLISFEATELADRLAKDHAGKDFNVDQTFNIPIFNILWQIVAGKRFDHDDPHLLDLQKLLSEVFRHAFKDLPFPLVTYVFPQLAGMAEKKKHTTELKRMFEQIVDNKIKEYDVNNKPSDFIEVYIKEMNSGNAALNYYDLIGLCMDFFEAGGETVGSTMSWVLMYMAMNREEQEKCFQEISAKLGDREPTLEDKSLLPYCDAFTMEVQRMSCVAPGGIGFQLREKKVIEGYTVPKDTLISYNIHKFHNDKDYWNDPEVFRPERFLSEDSLRVKKPERFVPFGMGRRICMGESLAKTELFLFAVIFMQRFEVSLPKFSKMPDLNEDICGITRSPKPFNIHLNLRN